MLRSESSPSARTEAPNSALSWERREPQPACRQNPGGQDARTIRAIHSPIASANDGPRSVRQAFRARLITCKTYPADKRDRTLVRRGVLYPRQSRHHATCIATMQVQTQCEAAAATRRFEEGVVSCRGRIGATATPGEYHQGNVSALPHGCASLEERRGRALCSATSPRLSRHGTDRAHYIASRGSFARAVRSADHDQAPPPGSLNLVREP